MSPFLSVLPISAAQLVGTQVKDILVAVPSELYDSVDQAELLLLLHGSTIGFEALLYFEG